MTSPNASRSERQVHYDKLAAQALSHDGAYTIPIGPFTISAHPRVFSPKYFSGSIFFAESLPELVRDGAFLEIGVGTGIASLYVAASPLRVSGVSGATGTDTRTVVGVDINPLAVELTRQNFRANNQAGRFLVSDIFDALEGSGERFDCIYWNHPWAWELEQSAQRDQSRADVMYLDRGYAMLRRFLQQARGYLKQGGSLILGTSEFADRVGMEGLYETERYASEVVGRRVQDVGDGMTEVFYLVRLKPE